jgi:hypothetical protein
MTSFDNTNRLVGRDGTPIAVDTILTLDQFTGKVSARNPIEKTKIYSFLNIFKVIFLKILINLLRWTTMNVFFSVAYFVHAKQGGNCSVSRYVYLQITL